MAAKTKPRSPAPISNLGYVPDLLSTPPVTTEDRLARIRLLGERVEGHIRGMCKAGALASTSAEAKGKAVTAFYERLVILERQLARIEEELQLRMIVEEPFG